MFQICFICAVRRVVIFMAVMFMAPEMTSCRRILKKTGGFLKAVYVL